MSSFSRFLKELPFLPKHFSAKQESVTRRSAGTELTGITINVYELEINDDSTDNSRDTDSERATTICPTPQRDDLSQRVLSSATTSRLDLASAQPLRYTNVVIFCRKCNTEISVRYITQHRRRHEALDMLKYSSDFPPKTMRALLRRRNAAMKDLLNRSDLEKGQVFHSTQKLNMAFEILKAEVEGNEEFTHINILRWREKDVRTEGKSFNSGYLLGISKYRASERRRAQSRTVHIDNFLENQGLFFAVYQGYNGCYVANLCARELHKEIKEHLYHFSEFGKNSEIIKSAFGEAYRKIDRIQLIGEGEHPRKRWSGCSAVTCLIMNSVLYVANEGNVKGFLVREKNTIRGITSSHDLYNRKERLRVRRKCGVIVKTEKCALVNGVLDTTRGLGNQGDWRLKVCVINKPAFRIVNLKPTDRMIILASEGIWRVFSFDDVLFLLNKFLHDASSKRLCSRERLVQARTPDGHCYLDIPSVHMDSEYRAYLKKKHVNPIDSRIPRLVKWNPDNPTIVIRRPSVFHEEALLKNEEAANNSTNIYFSDSEQEDEDLQELSKLLNHCNTESTYTRCEIARLLSKRLLKCALIAGTETDSVAVVLLLKGLDLEEYKCFRK